MAIISFGILDKKLLLIVLIVITRGINLVISNEFPEEYFNDHLSSLEEEIGPIIAGIIMIFLFKQKQKDSKNNRHFKYLIFLFLSRLIKSSYERIFPYVVTDRTYRFNLLLNTTNGTEIILMTIGTFLLLKYKYYVHHMISMFLFCILGITNDFILGSYFSIKYNYFFIYIIYIINEVFLFCYLKYMMDKLYYQYMEVLLYWGITGLIVKICIFSSLSIYEYKNDIEGIIHGVNSYFTGTKIFTVIIFQFLYSLIYPAFYFLLIILLMLYLRPNHMIVTDEINVYSRLIFYQDRPNKYYTLIPFVFQILALLFYFEILELNFCKLNYNTIKNIQLREGEDDFSKVSTLEPIELGQYYIKNYCEKEDKEINLNDNIDNKDNLSNAINDSFDN